MIDGYYVLLHRRYGVVLARRIPQTFNSKGEPIAWFYIWHDSEGKQHSARQYSGMITKMEPARVTPAFTGD